MPSIVHLAIFKPFALPESSRITSKGITLSKILTPSFSASRTSSSVAVISFFGNKVVKVTSFNTRSLAKLESWDELSFKIFSGLMLSSRSFFNVPRRLDEETTSIDVSPPPTHTTFLVVT